MKINFRIASPRRQPQDSEGDGEIGCHRQSGLGNTYVSRLSHKLILAARTPFYPPPPNNRSGLGRYLSIPLSPPVAIATVLTAMAVAYLSGARHDYVAYVQQWELILSGGNPWSAVAGNAYGPAYNLLACLFAFHPLLPKMAFVLSWQISSWYLVYQLARRGASLPWLIFWLTALPFNPLFWSFGVIYGSVDSLVAALCLIALAYHQTGRCSVATMVLALAALTKIYPIVFAPFLALDGRRINWHFLATFSALVAAGFALSFLMWGESTFHSIMHNSGRGSKMLSIFRFLRGDAVPWVDDVDHLSLPAMAIGGGLVFFLAWKWRLPAISGVLAGILVTLLLYKVGHQQFFLVVPLVAGLWYAHRLPHSDRLLGGALLLCLSWTAFMGALYLVTHYYVRKEVAGEFVRLGIGLAGEWSFLRDWVGLPTFVILLATLVAVMRYERREARTTPSNAGGR